MDDYEGFKGGSDHEPPEGRSGGHIFAGSRTRKRKYVLRGAADGVGNLRQTVGDLLKTLEVGGHYPQGTRVYWEVWVDAGPPKPRKSR